MSAATAPAPAFIVEQILRTRAIHLISGVSGIGKTTYLLQMLNDWTAGRDVLGRKSYPIPFAYVSCSRGHDDALEIINRCSFELPSDLFLTLRSDRTSPEDVSLEFAIKAARFKVPGMKLLVLDSIGTLCRGRVSEFNVVADFMRKARDICAQEGLTIIGVGSHSKTDAENTPRARFLGSVAWGEYASTMFVAEGQVSEPDRTIHVLSYNFPPEAWAYQFGPDGRFLLTTDESVALGALDMRLKDLQPGEEFSTANALEWAKGSEISRATVFRWLKSLVDDGRAEKVGKGLYRVRAVT